MDYLRYKNRKINHILSIPFVWMMVVPFVLLDIFLFIYQIIVFSLYKLSYIPRSRYIKIDRHKLSYLNFIEKINCAYCGYANGLMAYSTAVVAQTEFYWCGIKHNKYPDFKAPSHHSQFLEYNNKEVFLSKYKK